MRVRLRLDPRQFWVVESLVWYNFEWSYEQCFHGENAYERAHVYARALKHPKIEEIT
jgi:hypothetical protein